MLFLDGELFISDKHKMNSRPAVLKIPFRKG